MKLSHKYIGALLCSTAAMVAGGAVAYAQTSQTTTETPQAQDASDENIIVVTGSQIQGAAIDDALPVTVVSEVDIDNLAALSGDELFRSIPQAGFVAFNEQGSQANSPNGARGDIASINLRALGTGNTLLLINGRRMVLNPGFQTENFVPVVSPDTNTIPPGGVRRVEVLRDGASAVYGADAVAGVVNTYLRTNLTGGFLRADYRNSTGTSLHSFSFRGGYGFDFNEGRGNLTLYGYYFHENGAPTSIRDYSRSSDLRPFVVGTDFEGDTNFDNRSDNSPFGQFDIQGSGASSATVLRDDDFFIKPCSLFGDSGQPSDGRFLDLGNGLCADNGTTIDRAIRYDIAADRSLFSEKNRYNFSALFNYEVSDSVDFYLEGSYYRTKSQRYREASNDLSVAPIGILSTAYYNPLGAETLADGSPNPNRLDGLGSGVSAEGRNIQLEDYRVVDAGRRFGIVTISTFRVVGGLKGNLGNWDFDTGFLYSQANSNDLTRNRISSTALQDAINRTDATAYNPFNGGCLDAPTVGDCTPSNDAALDAIRVDIYRNGKTSLFLGDFKVSRPDLFTLPGGDVGIATGIEFRHETFIDDRDPRLDGTFTFTNAITGVTFGSDAFGSSPSPDTSGNREVYSAYLEAFVPLVDEDMNIPLIRKFDLQLAGRVEHFSDVKQTAVVPRVAAAWTPLDGVILRGAWSQGFRAPNLIQVNDIGTTRSNTRDLSVQCIAERIKGLRTSSCPRRGVVDARSGSRELEPEHTESINFGIVLSPSFLPGLTLTADFWRVRQDGLVGIFQTQNAINIDLLERLQGRSNPNVIRSDPDEDQMELYEGTGILPAGDILRIDNDYRNLDSRVSRGWDFGMVWDIDNFGIGDFRLRFNAALLTSFNQTPDADSLPLVDELPTMLAALTAEDGSQLLSAGDIARFAPVGSGQLLLIEGRPRWRFSGSVRWSSGPVDVSMFGRYVGSILDSNAIQDDTGEFYRVPDWFTLNVAVGYTVDGGALDGLRLRVGLNNIFNESPPFADENFGFYGSLHSARGRQLIIQVEKKF